MAAVGDGRALDPVKPLDASRPVPREPGPSDVGEPVPWWGSRESRRSALHRVHEVRHAASEWVGGWVWLGRLPPKRQH
ncbi:hypothetical protein, partial [Streptomyces sp. NPDC004592]